MTLLNPALWLGLLLAGVPILLHLLARRRLHRQPFPALDFLKQLQSSRLKRIRMRRWLLLLLRTLAVLLIALAFLRPAIRMVGSSAGNNATVVLLDLSASMSARSEGSTPLTRAKELYREIWASGGELALVVADGGGERDLPFRRAEGEPPEWIGRLRVDGRADDPRAAILRAVELLETRDEPVREILWISDFANVEESIPDSLLRGISLYRLDVGPKSAPRNVAVTGVQLLDPLPVPGELAAFEITLEQSGAEAEDSLLVVVNVDGRRAAEGRVAVPASGAGHHRFPLRLPAAGQHGVSVEVEIEDAFALDNRRAATLNVAPARRVVIAGDDFAGMRSLELALRARSEGGIEVSVVRGELGNGALVGKDLLLLVGRERPTSEESQRIASFVESGGGLWLIAGETMDLNLWNRRLLSALSQGEARDVVRFGGRGVAWTIDATNHAVFDGLPLGLTELPRVKRLIAAVPPLGARRLIRAGENRPLLMETTFGEGKVWWMTGAVGGEWSDWDLTGLFAPMVQRAAVYLADGEGGTLEVTCGEPLRWQGLPAAEEAKATDALGRQVAVARGAESGNWVVDATEWPGLVQLSLDGTEAAVGAVNLPASESKFTPLGENLLPGDELDLSQSLEEQLAQLRRGREISGVLLLLALLVLIVESLVARETGRTSKTKQAR